MSDLIPEHAQNAIGCIGAIVGALALIGVVSLAKWLL